MRWRVCSLSLLLASIGWPAYAQQPQRGRAEDARVVVAFDHLTRAATPPEGMSFRVPLAEDQEVVEVFLRLVRVKTGQVGVVQDSAVALIDANGNEHGAETLTAELNPRGRQGRWETLAGALIRAVFVLPKAFTPVAIRYVYAYWDSPEAAQAGRAEILVPIRRTGRR
jgi:hypothetical protein